MLLLCVFLFLLFCRCFFFCLVIVSCSFLILSPLLSFRFYLFYLPTDLLYDISKTSSPQFFFYFSSAKSAFFLSLRLVLLLFTFLSVLCCFFWGGVFLVCSSTVFWSVPLLCFFSFPVFFSFFSDSFSLSFLSFLFFFLLFSTLYLSDPGSNTPRHAGPGWVTALNWRLYRYNTTQKFVPLLDTNRCLNHYGSWNTIFSATVLHTHVYHHSSPS